MILSQIQYGSIKNKSVKNVCLDVRQRKIVQPFDATMNRIDPANNAFIRRFAEP